MFNKLIFTIIDLKIMSEDHYAYFSISPKEDSYQIHRRDRNSCLNSNQSYRKARIGALPYNDKR